MVRVVEERDLVEMCSPRFSVNSRTHLNFHQGTRILGTLGEMNLSSQWPSSCIFSFGKASDVPW